MRSDPFLSPDAGNGTFSHDIGELAHSRSDLVLRALDDVGAGCLLELDDFRHLGPNEVREVVVEYARFVQEVIAPTDRAGHRQGVRFDPVSGSIHTPDGFVDAYGRLVAAGWNAVPFPPADGGGGFPRVVGVAMQEMLGSANLSLSLCPVLTQSAIELLSRWGTEGQRSRYLPRLLTGEWTGTMLMTEPDAGSDVGAVRTTARPISGGRYALDGTKIYISWGEHDLADNIIHLVLARTPGSAPGTRGLSLFLVPRVHTGELGPDGERNAIRCIGVEEKMGLHASPTCVMRLDGAIGELVGEEGGGLRAMFTMMNSARLAIGLQGLAVGEAAYVDASAFAASRMQGSRVGGVRGVADPIDRHPDVRRMLSLMRADLDAMRLLVYFTALWSDLASAQSDGRDRHHAQCMVDLFTPVAKAWVTDLGVDVASLGIQVQGGMGYMQAGGGPQRFVDARIGPIYEGTNGIQAIDLVTRKLPLEGGELVRGVLDEMARDAMAIADLGGSGPQIGPAMLAAVESTRRSAEWLLGHLRDHQEDVLAGATPFLAMFGDLAGGWLLVRRAIAAARAARDQKSSTHQDRYGDYTMAVAAFYAVERLAGVTGREPAVTAGARRLLHQGSVHGAPLNGDNN